MPAELVVSANGVDPVNVAVEIGRVIPASGNLGVCGQQFWLGPSLGGVTIRLWIDTTVVHILRDDVRLKTLPSRFTPANLPQLLADGGTLAGPPPLATDAAGPFEVDRLVNGCGTVGLAGRQRPVGFHLAGLRVTVRFDGAVMQILDHDRTLLRTLANPLTRDLPPDLGHLRLGSWMGVLEHDGDEALPGPVQGGCGGVVPVEAGRDDRADR